jgi:cell pole-organizing protein PopZ
MEEILASIRRIISEEGTDAAPEGEAAGAGAASADAADPADDVLELTEVVEEPPPPPAPKKPAPAPAPAAASQDDIDAIMNGMFDEPAAPEAEPEAEPADEPEPEAAFEPEPAPEPEPEPVAAAPEPTRPVLRAVESTPAMPDMERIVSDAAAGAASAAFAGLAGVRRSHPDGWPIGMGHTVEDLVRELMRPMLKEWLDANLPGIVDRLVRQEIERIARNVDAA